MFPSTSKTANFTSAIFSTPCSRTASSSSSKPISSFFISTLSTTPSLIKMTGSDSIKLLTFGFLKIIFFTIKFAPNKTNAATKPPSKLTLDPTIAFCTAFEISKSSTISPALSCDNWFFPKTRIAANMNA